MNAGAGGSWEHGTEPLDLSPRFYCAKIRAKSQCAPFRPVCTSGNIPSCFLTPGMNFINRPAYSLILCGRNSILPSLVNSRAVSIKCWPTIDNPWRTNLEVQHAPANIPEYSISKEEFKYVELLKPCDLVPPPPSDDKKTPSGWIPPRPQLSARKPYTVTRSQRKRREQTYGKRMLTVITKVGGDMQALASDLEALLKPKCESGLFLCQVDEATRKIIIDGIFLDEVSAFLIENGF
nr:unnamed protein product [Spirometra erinaceieuropaei]